MRGGGGGGSIVRTTPDIGLASYSIIPLRKARCKGGVDVPESCLRQTCVVVGKADHAGEIISLFTLARCGGGQQRNFTNDTGCFVWLGPNREQPWPRRGNLGRPVSGQDRSMGGRERSVGGWDRSMGGCGRAVDGWDCNVGGQGGSWVGLNCSRGVNRDGS